MGLQHEQDELRRQLTVAGERLSHAQVGVDLARKAVDQLVISALWAGISPGEVNRLVPLSRETIRTLARIAGIPAAPRGGVAWTDLPSWTENDHGVG